MLVAPELLRLTVELAPDVRLDIRVLDLDRFTVVELPVEEAPPLLTAALRFEYPPLVRAAVDVVLLCFTLPVLTPDDPRTTVDDFARA